MKPLEKIAPQIDLSDILVTADTITDKSDDVTKLDEVLPEVES